MIKYLFSILLSAVLLASCAGKTGGEATSAAGDTLTTDAELLTLVKHDGWVSATIADPWSQGKTLATYCFVPRTSEVPAELSSQKDVVIIRTPVKSAIVYSSVYTQGIEDLGQAPTIKGVADTEFFTHGYVKKHLDSGDIANIGLSSSPSMEKIVDISPDVLILSPYEANRNDRVLDKTGVAVIRMVDYMESTPLGRAEWIKLLGVMYDDIEGANKVYASTSNNYKEISRLVAAGDSRPMILTDTEVSGTWYQPGGGSYAAHLIQDAGGQVAWNETTSTGSLPCDYAAVYERASNAAIWIMRTFGKTSLEDLRKANPLNGNIKALKDGKVYYTDTSTGTYFDDIAFHPDRILSDYAAVFHPEVWDKPLKYFVKAQ